MVGRAGLPEPRPILAVSLGWERLLSREIASFSTGLFPTFDADAGLPHGPPILGEQFLLYAESMAHRGKQVSMARLLAKLKELIAMHEYPAFPGYSGQATREQADAHVRRQIEIYRRRLPKPRAA